MKKIALIAISGCLASGLFAQKNITTGSIAYQLSYDFPDSVPPMIAIYLPRLLTVYFKDDSLTSVGETPMVLITELENTKTGRLTTLVAVPAADTKQILKPNNRPKPPAPQFANITAGTDTKMIAGYNAQQYTATEQTTGKKVEIWFTRDITIPANKLTRPFPKEYGIPLEFSTLINGIPATVTTTEIKTAIVPAGIFAIPVGYKPA